MLSKSLMPVEVIRERIYLVRGHRVMLDADLAKLYGVSTKRLNEQVRRNRGRFPGDFMFTLTDKEAKSLRSQFATSKTGRGGRRYLPLVFTEHGAVMLASVLNTRIAIQASIQIARAFVVLRQIVSTHRELVKKLDDLERKIRGHDVQIEAIFDAIRQLMRQPRPKRIPDEGVRRPIGFRA